MNNRVKDIFISGEKFISIIYNMSVLSSADQKKELQNQADSVSNHVTWSFVIACCCALVIFVVFFIGLGKASNGEGFGTNLAIVIAVGAVIGVGAFLYGRKKNKELESVVREPFFNVNDCYHIDSKKIQFELDPEGLNKKKIK